MSLAEAASDPVQPESCIDIFDPASGSHATSSHDDVPVFIKPKVLLLLDVAYTLLTLFRSVTQRSDENRSMPWAALLRWVYRAVVGASNATISGLRQREATAATL